MPNDFLRNLMNESENNSDNSRISSRRSRNRITIDESNIDNLRRRAIDEIDNEVSNRRIGDSNYIDRVRTENGIRLNQRVDDDNLNLESIRNDRLNRLNRGERNNRRGTFNNDESDGLRINRDDNDSEDGGRLSRHESGRRRNTPYSNVRIEENAIEREGILAAILGILLAGKLGRGNNILNKIFNKLIPGNSEADLINQRDRGRPRRRMSGDDGYEENKQSRFSLIRFIVGTSGLLILIFIMLVVYQFTMEKSGINNQKEIFHRLNKFVEEVSGGDIEGKTYKGFKQVEDLLDEKYIEITPSLLSSLEFNENGLTELRKNLYFERVDKNNIIIYVTKNSKRQIEYSTKEKSGELPCVIIVDKDGNIFNVIPE